MAEEQTEQLSPEAVELLQKIAAEIYAPAFISALEAKGVDVSSPDKAEQALALASRLSLLKSAGVIEPVEDPEVPLLAKAASELDEVIEQLFQE